MGTVSKEYNIFRILQPLEHKPGYFNFEQVAPEYRRLKKGNLRLDNVAKRFYKESDGVIAEKYKDCGKSLKFLQEHVKRSANLGSFEKYLYSQVDNHVSRCQEEWKTHLRSRIPKTSSMKPHFRTPEKIKAEQTAVTQQNSKPNAVIPAEIASELHIAHLEDSKPLNTHVAGRTNSPKRIKSPKGRAIQTPTKHAVLETPDAHVPVVSMVEIAQYPEIQPSGEQKA